MTAKRLSDLIIEHGRWTPGEALPEWADEEYAAAQINALRDELIELREIAARCLTCGHVPTDHRAGGDAGCASCHCPAYRWIARDHA